MCAQPDVCTWLQEAQDGSADAFGRLVTHYEPALFAFLLLRTRDPDLSQEAVQETLVRAYENLAKFDASQPFHSWLFGIASHVASEGRRKRKMQHRVLEFVANTFRQRLSGQTQADPERSGGAIRERFLQAVNECPENYRVPLALRYLDEMTYEEIAAVLQRSPGQVKGLLYRGKQMLRERLADLNLPTRGPQDAR